jgi:hypothetical protein
LAQPVPWQYRSEPREVWRFALINPDEEKDYDSHASRYLHLAEVALQSPPQPSQHEESPMTSVTLRIDESDGQVIDYKIEDDGVEVRRSSDDSWERLTPQQLTFHITTNPAIAHWLRRRMGVHQLVRACNQDLIAA